MNVTISRKKKIKGSPVLGGTNRWIKGVFTQKIWDLQTKKRAHQKGTCLRQGV